MDLEQQEIVRLAVEDILAGADMENITEKQVRKLAEDETGLDLSHPVGRKLVLSMISAFLDGNGDKAEEEVESEEDDEEKTKKQKKKKKTTKAKKEDRSRREEEEEEEEKETLATRLTKDKTGRYTEDDRGSKKQHLMKKASQHKQKRAFKDDEDEDTDGSEEEEERNVKGKKKPKFEKDEQGNIIICELSARRKVIVQQWKGQTLISLREYYEKDGKLLPTSKGISLTVEQFEILAKKIKDIEAAITSIQ
ncbi:hypothetical protein CY35_15G056700 [Sphagnum magellanicum]|nr:hypothetical protein CY35_15G056700 [Sphagnum magellanicum]